MRNSNGATVDVQNLSGGHIDGAREFISGFSSHISPGEWVVIVGPSGEGKTSFLKLLLGLQTPINGAVKIDGVPISEYTLQNPGKISYLPQSAHLVAGTLIQNITLEEIATDSDWAEELVGLCGLGELVRELPNGISTDLSDRAVSGGQRQRIGLARALYTRPRVLGLDEPTSGLDAANEKLIHELIGSILSTTTVLAVSHSRKTAEYATEVWRLSSGAVTKSTRSSTAGESD